MRFLFFFCLSIIVYAYFVYPLWLAVLSVVFKRRPRREEIYPFVSFFLLDEQGSMSVAEKVGFVLSLDYPRDRLEILLGVDGASDELYRCVKKLAEEKNIRYAVSFQRLGRSAMINKLSRDARGDIFIFLDARHKIEKSFLKEMAACFADGDVGYVGARLKVTGPQKASFGFCHVREQVIRGLENATASVLVPTGGAYALRRELFKYLPKENSAFGDDAYELMNAVVADKRAVMEASARTSALAEDVSVSESLAEGLRGRCGDFQLCSLFMEIALSLKNRMAFRFLAHKVLPLALAYVLIALFLASAALAGKGTIFFSALIGQMIFYGLAFLTFLTERTGMRWPPVLRWPYEFCLFHFSSVLALRLFLSGEYNLKWED